jgi:hypothetical protein
MARKVINPKSTGNIRFAATQVGLAAGLAASDQVTGFKLTPSANLADIPATFGAAAGQSAAASSWNLELSLLQDWGNGATSVSKYLFDNDGVLVWFRHDPAGATEDSFEGQCYAVAGGFGGDADENWVDDLTLPCPVKPTRIDPA